MKSIAFRCTVGVCSCPSKPWVAQAGTVSGQFVLGDKAVPLHEVAAFRMRDQFNPAPPRPTSC